MKNSELIEKLTLIKEQSNSDFIGYTLTQAIKCIEVESELIEALEEARDILLDDDNHGGYYWEDEINKYKDIIQRAKELIE